jgi:glycosyltransferase involved in cell wall biosynthesis
MRIGIDAREIKRPDTGVGTYVLNLIIALAKIDQKNQYFLFVDNDLKDWPVLPENFSYCNISTRLPAKLQDQYQIVRSISKYKVDIFHVTHHEVMPLLSSIPMIITVLDVSWLDYPSNSLIFQYYYRQISLMAMRKAIRIVTISHSTKQRVEHHFPFVKSKIQAIPIACDPFYKQEFINDHTFDYLVNEFDLQKPYVLYVGSFAQRKNLTTLIKAMLIVNRELPELQLVLAGKPSGRSDTPVDEYIQKLPLKLITRPKTKAEIRYLYHHATMLVFPSKYEGFGLPVLEAMTCGCPVIAADATSLPEIVGEAALLIDVDDVQGLANEILRLVQDQPLRQKLINEALKQSQKFNWASVAQQTLENYNYTFAGAGLI